MASGNRYPKPRNRSYQMLERRLQNLEDALVWQRRIMNLVRLSMAAFIKLLHK